MHLDAAILVAPTDFVLEPVKVEIRAQFTIHTSKKVLVEGGRNTGSVVVGCEHAGRRFYKIGSDQHRVTF